jgi:GTPase SAR1 family protein
MEPVPRGHGARFDIDLFDLGGGKRIRGIWKAYMADVHGCIFVVDSAALDRIQECREAGAYTRPLFSST